MSSNVFTVVITAVDTVVTRPKKILASCKLLKCLGTRMNARFVQRLTSGTKRLSQPLQRLFCTSVAFVQHSCADRKQRLTDCVENALELDARTSI
jgi:hypothetical protein